MPIQDSFNLSGYPNSLNKFGNSLYSENSPRKKINKGWKNEPNISVFKADLNLAIAAQGQQIDKINEWLKNLNAESDPEMLKKGRSGIQPKLIRKMAEWRYSSLANPFLNTSSLFTVTASSYKDLNASIQAEKILNYQFNILIDKVKFINDLVRTAVNEGTAIIRVGWINDERERVVQVPVYKYRKPDLAELKEISVRTQQYLKLFNDTNGQMVAPNENTGQQPTGQVDQDGNPIMGQNPADMMDQMGGGGQPPMQPPMQGQPPMGGGMPPMGGQPDPSMMGGGMMGGGMPPADPSAMGGGQPAPPNDGLTQAIQQQYGNPSLKLPDGAGGMDGSGGRNTILQSIKDNMDTIRDINEKLGKPTTTMDFQLAYKHTMQQLNSDPNFYRSVIDPDVLDASLDESFRRGTPVVAVKTNKFTTYKEIETVANHPIVEVVNNADVFIDPTCMGDIDKAQFIVYKFETCLSDLRSQKSIYNNLDELEDRIKEAKTLAKITKNSKDIASMSDEDFENLYRNSPVVGGDFLDEPRAKLVAYEYWGYYDIDDTGMTQPIVATIVNDVIIRLEKSPYPDGKLPFVTVAYLPVKESVYGEPDGALLKDNQTIITALTRGFVDLQAKSAAGQIAIPKGYTDGTNLQKLYSGQNYMYNPGIGHPKDAVYIHSGQEIPQSAIQFFQMQNTEAEALTGVKTYSQGLDQTSFAQSTQGKTFVGMPVVTYREGDILQRFKKALEKVGNKVISMNAEFLNPVEVIAISRYKFEEIKREDLKGNFSISVDIKSPLESQSKAQDLAFILQTLGPTVDFTVTKPILQQIASLYGLDDLVHDLDSYQPQPDPLEQALKQAEIQKAQAQAAELQAKAQKAQAEAQKAMSEVKVNEAKANYITSMANKLDQEFLDQQTGTDFERKKALIQAQGKSQGINKLAEGGDGQSPDVTKNARDQILGDDSSAPFPQDNDGDSNGNGIPNPISGSNNNANGVPIATPPGGEAKAPTGEPPGGDGGDHELSNLFSKIGA